MSETLLFHARFLRCDALFPSLRRYLLAAHRLMEGDMRRWRLTD
ncbi:hypothetical protein [Falsiroseomonas oryzae]|nr:hypothetical protein [Roseomonas sp. MO-31]